MHTAILVRHCNSESRWIPVHESKKNYRKPTDLVKERKDTTDYSCVAQTGSPCPEGLVPREIQKGIVEALDGVVK